MMTAVELLFAHGTSRLNTNAGQRWLKSWKNPCARQILARGDMFRDGGGEQCRGACSEVLPEEIKEAAPGLVRDGGVGLQSQ